VPQLYARGEAAGLGINVWFMLVDPDNPEAFQHGLVTAYPDLDPKPSYIAYQTLAEQLTSTDYVQRLGVSEVVPQQIEAYEFWEQKRLQRVVVAWSNDESSYTMGLAGVCLTVIDKYGVENGPICDGGDGIIEVSIGPSPVYLRLP
jgi:hypothetical protein